MEHNIMRYDNPGVFDWLVCFLTVTAIAAAGFLVLVLAEIASLGV